MDEQDDINAAVEEAILDNADAFIAADAAVDAIMEWAEQELEAREKTITAAGGGVDEYKAAAQEVETEVARRLTELESRTREQYPEPVGD